MSANWDGAGFTEEGPFAKGEKKKSSGSIILVIVLIAVAAVIAKFVV